MKRPTSLPPLVGPAGQTIARREIEAEPRSGPTLTGVRSAVSQFRSTGLSPQRCAAILRRAAEGDWQAFLELAEEMEERDPHYQAVLSVRRRQVSQLPITVEAVSDDPAHVEHADFIRRWIKRGILRLALFDVLDAIGKGFSVHEITWTSHPKSGIYPRVLHYRPPRWFAADDVDKDTPLLRGLGQNEPLAEHLYLLHKHPSKSGLTIRSGLAYLSCWSWMLKRFSDADWAAFVERYGSPLRVGKYDPASSEADRDVLWRAVANIAGDCAAIIPASMSIEFVDAMKGGASAELHERRARYLDEQISKVVLGQTTTTDAISGGHAVSKEHRKVAEDIERADGVLLSATITHRLVPWIVSLNFGPQDDYPAVLIGKPDEIPLKDWMDGVDKAARLGVRIGQSVVRDRLAIEEPDEGEELLGDGTPAPAVSSGFGPLPSLAPQQPGLGALAPKPTPTAAPEAVADTGLNGAQVQAIAGILEKVRSGEIPKASAIALIVASFPSMGEERARAMVDPIEVKAPGAAPLPALMARFDAAANGSRKALMSVEERSLEAAMAARLAADAGPAIATHLATIRAEMEAATSLEDLKKRLDALKLDPALFAAAMTEGIFLAEAAGRAALLEELERGDA